MNVTKILAQFAVHPPTDFLTPGLLKSVKERFLDTVGIMVAGAESSASRILTQSVNDCGGVPDATIIGTSHRTSIVQAGFVNGASAHALEYDDLTPDITHMSSSMVPGCLAMAEKCNATGRQLVEAFALGFEVAGRVALGMKSLAMLDRGFHTPGIIGGLGVAVAASRLMGSDTSTMRMAMGLMASSGGGIRKNVGSAGKAFHIGNGVRAGLQAALLAAAGYKVDPDAIEGEAHGHGHQRFGLVETYAGSGNYSLDRMVLNLGEEFSLTRIPTMVRMHPCSTVNCVAIDGMIDLANEFDLTSNKVASVNVACHPRLLMIAPYDEPTDSYRAKFCPAYTMAAALVDRRVGLAQFEDERISDPEILALMRRIKIEARTDIPDDQGWCNGENNWCAVTVTMNLSDGTVIRRHFDQARGWPARPVSWQDLCSKYVECIEGSPTTENIESSMQMIAQLEDVTSVRDLIAHLRIAK